MLPGLNLMLLGPSGSGKTTAIRTWLDADIQPFVLFTEPSFEVIGDDLCPAGRGIHWNYIAPSAPDWADMMDSAKKINTLDLKTLSGLSDIKKTKYQQFIEVLTLCNNFTCKGCKKSFGDISTWDTSRAFVIDSLSGINAMAMNLVVGSKPVKAMSDWGIAMDNEERFIQKLCVDKQCHFMLIGHTEREVDEITGGTNITVSTLGRKLAPKLPRFFSDVVLAKRDGSKFFWSTTAIGVDLKARNLEFSDTLQPVVKQLIDTWKKHGGVVAPQPQPATTN
jgi:hypothetical protein